MTDEVKCNVTDAALNMITHAALGFRSEASNVYSPWTRLPIYFLTTGKERLLQMEKQRS